MGDPEGEWLAECDVEPEVFRGEAKGLLDIIYAVQNDRHVNIPWARIIMKERGGRTDLGKKLCIAE